MDAFLKGVSKSAGSGKMVLAKENSRERKKQMVTPWVEKYRPKTVDEVAYQEEVVAVLKRALEGADFPNLLFYGPPGTGKTSTILALCREMFGDMFRSRILELNASDERGIQVVRDKVKTFAQQTASNVRPDGRPCPSFKVVILDEADSMTDSAQAALRRTMEKESRSTRFCLICNYVSRIIEPLTSRCAKFRFKPLAKDILVQRLQHISNAEDVKLDDGVLEALVERSEGDLRRAITLLQSAHRLKGRDGINLDDVAEVAGVIPDKSILGLLETCKSDSYNQLERFVSDLITDGFSAAQLLLQFHDHIVFNSELGDKEKSIICERIALCDHRLMDGASEYLQLMDVCTVVMQQLCHGAA